jgi:hypothetical protein
MQMCALETGDSRLTIPCRIPMGGWLRSPFEGIIYRGEQDPQNAALFVKRFESIARDEGVDERTQLSYFKRCMKGSASDCMELKQPRSIEEAKQAFIQHYWGTQAQAYFRREINFARYNPNGGLSMAEYTLQLMRKARTLEPPMVDIEFIYTVKEHFTDEIRKELRPTSVRTVEEMVNILEIIDYERANRKSSIIGATVRQTPRGRGYNGAMNVANVRGNGQRGGYNNTSYYPYRNQAQRAIMAAPTTVANRQATVGQRMGVRNTYGTVSAIQPWQQRSRFNPRGGYNGAGLNQRSANHNQRSTSQPKVEFPLSDSDGEDKKGKAARGEQTKKSNGAKSQPYKNRQINAICASTSKETDGEEKKTDGENGFEEYLNILRTEELTQDLDGFLAEEQRKEIKRCRAMPKIKIAFESFQETALVDTGAQLSVISKDVYDKLIESNERMDIIPVRKFGLRGAFSERGAVVANKVRVSFKYEGEKYTYEFNVVEKIVYEVVLGMDFMMRFKAVIDCREAKPTFRFHETDGNGGNVPLIGAITVEEAENNLMRLLDEHCDLFDDTVGRINHYECQILLKSNRPYKKKTYPIPEIHLPRVRKYMRNLERTGIIRREATEFVNPLVVVVKKSGDIRLCLDARELNKRIASDHAQPPTIEEVFRRIGTKRIFSTLDVAQAFWQVPLEEESKKFTGFLFDGQTYVFNRMPFGIKTAGAAFTRAMSLALGTESDEYMIVYLDDILIASNSIEEHIKHIEHILNRLERHGFKLNRDKCEFMKTEITFLGHTFNEIQAEINTDTKMAIANFERPKCKKEIQMFLGLVNWDRRFIQNLARQTKPLEQLLCKGEKYEWTKERQDAFNEIKRAFQEAPNLFLIRPGYRFGIYVDAARNGLGARLYQYAEGDERKYTVAYASRSLKGSEARYTITELEGLALVWALRRWHTLLLGRHVRVHTDP